jgi:hypothetical protein
MKKLGFDGPYMGGNHEFMLRGTVRLTLPNPHRSEISTHLLGRLLRQASISREDWEEAGK